MWSAAIPKSTNILILALSSLLILPTPTIAHPVALPYADAKSARFDVGALFNATSPLGMLLGPLAGALSAFLGETGNPTVQNELVTDGVLSGIMTMGNATAKKAVVCPAMSVLFARGTDEAGNVGILAGPPFFAALGAYMNNTISPSSLSIQGVPYIASVSSFLTGGSKLGAANMAAMINTTLVACPNTRLTVSGYSQGAQVVHMAMAALPAAVTGKISSVVLFGDPMNGTAVTGVKAERTLVVCHKGDNICAGGDVIKKAHLTYGKNAGMAAMFALSGVAMLGISSADMKSVMENMVS